MEEQGTRASRTRKRSEAGAGRPEAGGVPSNDPRNNQHNPKTPTSGHRLHANGTSCHIQHSPGTPTTGLRERGNDTGRSTGRGSRQNAATSPNMRREERGTAQGPVKKQHPDGMSHGGGEGDPLAL